MRRFLQRLAAISALLLSLATAVPAWAETLYVTMNDNTVVTYDTSSNNATTIAGTKATFADQASGIDDPSGLAFDSAGNLFVGNRSSIMKYDSLGNGSTVTSTGVAGAVSLAFDAANNLFVANLNFNNILKITPSGNQSTFASLPNAWGVATDSAGNVYASDTNGFTTSDSITKFDSSGNGSLFASGLGTPMLAFDSAGNLYATNNDRITKFNSAGVGSTFATTDGFNPIDITFDSAGNLYATDFNNSTISKFDSAGAFQFSWATKAERDFFGASPRSLAFRPETGPETASVPEIDPAGMGSVLAGSANPQRRTGRRCGGCSRGAQARRRGCRGCSSRRR
jgi:hypothetical protein